MQPGLIDRIYESAFVPELWQGVLADLAEIAGARAGFLFVSKGDIHRWTSSTAVGREFLKPLVEGGWVARSERFVRLLALRHPGFLTDDAIYTAEEMNNDPFYRDILFPRGLGRAAGMTVALPTGDWLSLSVEREWLRGSVEPPAIEALDALRPHLARSGMMSARLQLERAQAAGEALALIGLAALVLDEKGKVLVANDMVHSLADLVQWRAFDLLSLKDRRADKLLRKAMASLGAATAAGVHSFPVRNSDGDAAMVAHVIPIRRSARDIFVRCAALLLLTPVAQPHAPPVELVQALFDLTPAEARVARDLASGKTVDDIAANGGVSPNTVRFHVRGVLEKTGCNRQGDVIALLTGISSAPLAYQ